MQNTADAVIVGGGVMGCSILYNLARQGMQNLVSSHYRYKVQT